MNSHLKVVTYLTDLLDNRFKIAGFRFGLDPILGLFPGLGDIIPLVISFYMVWIGIQMKMPSDKITQMIVNIIIDFVIGLVPLIGDFSDFVFKSNTKNLVLLREHYASKAVDGEVVS